ncbi:protein translocase subunit SecF [bacterium]|nr:protein translocase subunit SecF [bacterium]
MDVLREGKYFRYVERAPVWLTISMIVIAIGIAFMVLNKVNQGSAFNLSIHYTGGEKLILRLLEEAEFDGQNVKTIVSKYADGEAVVQVDQTDPHIITIRMRVAGEGETEGEISRSKTRRLTELKEELGTAYGGYSATEGSMNPETIEQDFVGPTVGAELIQNAVLALIIGCVLIMLYILLRFGRWQMSLAAIAALIHDVLITLGFTSVLQLEVSDSFIAVILTIIGYSINDTIIIFDRIRENAREYGDKHPLAQICNLSLNQTLMRSLNTVITVIIMIVALMILGGENIRDFLTAMLIGMISGGYSSIFIATPLMLWITGGKMKIEAEAEGGGSAAAIRLDVPDAEDSAVSDIVSDAQDLLKKKKAVKRQRRR